MCEFFTAALSATYRASKMLSAEALFFGLLRDAEVRGLFKVNKYGDQEGSASANQFRISPNRTYSLERIDRIVGS
jgi:hypothetical protein